MASLRDRLKRIQKSQKTEAHKIIPREEYHDLLEKGWEPCGYKVYKKETVINPEFKYGAVSKRLPEALSILIPDLQEQPLPSLEDFLFFDLETTGLSGGAGTVAFLAAFAGITCSEASSNDAGCKNTLCNECNLRVTQYLLLDYPGENDFLLNALSEFNKKTPVIVSYNGKCFDSQILKTRCLMNRIKTPEYRHVDLLHPARRLWKNIIKDCGQISIESKILKRERLDDTPGSLAPDIWFEFLKTGRTDRLTGICDHNKDDIKGLVSIFFAMILIAENPHCGIFQFDLERLALRWRKYLNLRKTVFRGEDILRKTGNNLLRLAAEKNYPRAVYVYIYDLIKIKNFKEAYKFVKEGLRLFDESTVWHQRLLRRKERLEKIISR